MSVIQMRMFSEKLGMYTPVTIILPLPRDAKTEIEPLPVLYLLHGMGDNHSAWLRKSAVERYAQEKGIAIVMPDGELSCYEDMAHGRAYRSFITGELWEYMGKNFPLSKKRNENFIAGCSMGGFGALKLAIANPDKWSAVGCFSAAHFEYRPDAQRNRDMLNMVYGDRINQYDAQIAADIASVNEGSLPMRIWHSCGDADVLKENALKSRSFFEALEPNSIHYHFEMLPGRHDWALWDESLRRFMDALNLSKPEVRLF